MSTFSLVMEPVERMPISRARKGLAEHAEHIAAAMPYQDGPVRAAVSGSRTPLERISRHLRAMGSMITIVSAEDKDPDGTPTRFALYVRWDPTVAPSQPVPRSSRG